MKRFFLITVLFLIAGATYVLWPTSTGSISPVTNTPEIISPAPLPLAKTITVNGQTMAYAFTIPHPSRVTLLPNFSKPKTSQEIIKENNCTSGINGGFYDTENRPLGLFVNNFQTLRDPIKSKLLNGYLGIGATNNVFMGDELLDTHNRVVLQTGPLLMVNGQPVVLAITNDEPARRMVAAVDRDNYIVFMALYEPASVFDGPLLEELPMFVAAVDREESLNVIDAVNLDGGSASAFYSPETTLSELTPIGSFFCVK